MRAKSHIMFVVTSLTIMVMSSQLLRGESQETESSDKLKVNSVLGVFFNLESNCVITIDQTYAVPSQRDVEAFINKSKNSEPTEFLDVASFNHTQGNMIFTLKRYDIDGVNIEEPGRTLGFVYGVATPSFPEALWSADIIQHNGKIYVVFCRSKIGHVTISVFPLDMTNTAEPSNRSEISDDNYNSSSDKWPKPLNAISEVKFNRPFKTSYGAQNINSLSYGKYLLIQVVCEQNEYESVFLKYDIDDDKWIWTNLNEGHELPKE